MLTPLVDWKPVVTLVPFSGVQCLDFGFDLDAVGRLSRSFLERRDPSIRHADGREKLAFLPLTGDPEIDEKVIGRPHPGDQTYEITKSRALEPFLNKWVPIPVLRLGAGRGSLGEILFDKGPTNWARVYVTACESVHEGRRSTHRAVFAFDTELLPRSEGKPYVAPSVLDAEDEEEFKLATDPNLMGWFLAWPNPGDFDGHDPQVWVDDWLGELFHEFKQAQRSGRPLRPEDFPYEHEHWARYITFLDLLDRAIEPPRFKLLDTVSKEQRYSPVQVDLVLDIGNSRTCGILIESYPDDPIDLNNSFVLRLRDLSQPQYCYAEPFESRVEFAHASFGKEHLARRSGRNRSHFWPSLVRIGPEAMRMAGHAEGTEVTTGMSSPKRYLWSTDPVDQEWRFQQSDYSANGEEPTIARAARRLLTESGEVLRQLEAEDRAPGQRRTRRSDQRQSALRSRFSRSSLYGFMLAEILIQALVQINDPGIRAGRRQNDVPRRLRQVIVTLPPATPLSEQRIMRRRAEGAVKLVWDLMGWGEGEGAGVFPPRVVIRWDEASCTQLVWLYTEITQKFSGHPREFVRLMGRERAVCHNPEAPPPPDAPAEPSLRVASIDIGGGTTDLMITTFHVIENRALVPTQNFREGFKIAGDDVLEAVIARIVLPGFEPRLEACGIREPRNLLNALFGGDRANMREQQKLLRRLFVTRVAIPIALAMLRALEDAGNGFADHQVRDLPFAWFFGMDETTVQEAEVRDLIGAKAADYLEDAARQAGATGFRLVDCTFRLDLQALDEVVRSVLRGVMGLLAEAVDLLNCDIVLLTGRPSRLPSVADLLLETLAVTPDRIVPMHRYRTGIWYPFRGRDNVRIDDPKTTAVVGGMLCALAESQIQNFMLQSDRLILRSTAKYIGEMEGNGQILDERLYFSSIDLDRRDDSGHRATIRLFAPMHIGFRQLPLERWMATPLYRLEPANSEAFARQSRPLKVTLERSDVDRVADADATAEELQQLEATLEEFLVTDVVDAQDAQLKSSEIILRLQTLGRLDAYWLDSGIVPLQ